MGRTLMWQARPVCCGENNKLVSSCWALFVIFVCLQLTQRRRCWARRLTPSYKAT